MCPACDAALSSPLAIIPSADQILSGDHFFIYAHEAPALQRAKAKECVDEALGILKRATQAKGHHRDVRRFDVRLEGEADQ
jgi:hypothetical protein